MQIKFNEVTWYSKLAAVVFMLGIFPALTFYIGMRYAEVRYNFEGVSSVQLSDINKNVLKPKWVGTSYCWNAQPNGTKEVGSYNNLQLIETKEGKEIWAVDALDQSTEFLNHTKDCAQIFTVTDTLKFPPIESGLTLAIDNCYLIQPDSKSRYLIVDLVDKNKFANPDFIEIKPIQAWKANFKNATFQNISTSDIICHSDEPDPV